MNQAGRQRAKGVPTVEEGLKAVEEYLAQLPPDARKTLQKLRREIKAAAPHATEQLAYQMPAFRQGRLIVSYAAFKHHCSLFPMSLKVMRDMAEDLKGYEVDKGTIRCPPGKPLPSALVRRIVKARLAENEARLAARKRR